MQQALTRAWLNRTACTSADPLPWLMTIVRREAWRSQRRRRELLTDPPVPAPDHAAAEAIETAPERLDLLGALRALDPWDRTALLLRYGADMTQPAVAEALDTPEGTVKVRLHRARQRIRGMLADS